MTEFEQLTHGKYCIEMCRYPNCKHYERWNSGYGCEGGYCNEDHMIDKKCDEDCEYFEEVEE